jgi:hypothetical protein
MTSIRHKTVFTKTSTVYRIGKQQGQRLENPVIEVQFSAGTRKFSFSRAARLVLEPIYPVGTGDCFPRGEVAEE